MAVSDNVCKQLKQNDKARIMEQLVKKIIKISWIPVLAFLYSSAAFADVPVKASLCNNTEGPVEFHLFNHNDITSGAAALSTKAVRACSCVAVTTNTDLWHNFPIARINQLVYRDVEGTTGSSIKVCIDAKGKFEGYIDSSVNTCVEAKKETKYLPAPELTRAQGDLPILQTHLYTDTTECEEKDWTDGCSLYDADYDYSDGDGVACTGHN